MSFNKAKIKSNFNRFSTNYNSQALLQKQVAKDLFDLAKSKITKSQNILDLGSGSGFIAKNILDNKEFLDKNIFQLDIAFDMLANNQIINKNINNINADIDNLPFVSNSFDLALSSLAFQWLEDLNRFFYNLKNILKSQPSLAFSIFIDKTLFELKESARKLGINLSVNDFINFEDLNKILKQNFKNYKITSKDFILEYDDVYHMLRSIKNIGASYSKTNKNKTILKKKDFEDLNSFYLKKFNIHGRIRVSWKVAYVII